MTYTDHPLIPNLVPPAPSTDDFPTLLLREESPIRIVNEGTKPWKDMYSGHPYRLAPGQEGIAPFGAICLWFGHPDARDFGDGKNLRQEEFARLRVRYGAYEGEIDRRITGQKVNPNDPDAPPGSITGDVLWERNRPHIACHTMDGSMIRLLTVIDDPEGKQVHTATQTLGEKDALAEMIRQQSAALQAMQARIDAMESSSAPTPPSAPIDPSIPFDASDEPIGGIIQVAQDNPINPPAN